MKKPSLSSLGKILLTDSEISFLNIFFQKFFNQFLANL